MSFLLTDQTIPAVHRPNFSIRERLAAAFRAAMAGSSSPAKELARRLDITPKGAELILRGETTPRAETLLAAMLHFDEVWREVQSMARREPADAEMLLDELAHRLAARRR